MNFYGCPISLVTPAVLFFDIKFAFMGDSSINIVNADPRRPDVLLVQTESKAKTKNKKRRHCALRFSTVDLGKWMGEYVIANFFFTKRSAKPL